jgi:hypothetical protein
MTGVLTVGLTALAIDGEVAHQRGVTAAAAGLQDAGLGVLRLSGSAVPVLAEAAVSSATPFLRAPLLSRLARIGELHPLDGTEQDPATCPSCGTPTPCATARFLHN